MPYFQRNNQPATNGGATNNVDGNGGGYLSINRKITTGHGLVQDLVDDLVTANAFRVVENPAGGDTNPSSGTPIPDRNSTDGWVILEATGCDPLWTMIPGMPTGFGSNQNWRIGINSDDLGALTIAWGSPAQIDETKSGPSGDVVDPGTPRLDMLADPALIGRDPAGGKYDYHYQLVTTDRGFALAVYPSTKENDAWYHRVLCIQRPTNPITGDIKQTDQAPVFVVHSGLVDDNNITSSFVERTLPNGTNVGVGGVAESKPNATGTNQPGWFFGPVRDASNPSATTTEPMNVPSSNLLYTFDWEWFQPPLLDNYNHVIKFPFGMCLAGRHIYLDEMDILGLVHGSTFGFAQESTLDLYTPTQSRTYAAGPGHFGTRATQILTTGGPPSQGADIAPFSRVVFLKDGPSVLT